jgi:hypothetical protein
MRISVQKRYAKLIRLVAIANGEGTPSLSMPKIGPRFETVGWITYTRTDARVMQIRDALISLAMASHSEKRELRFPVSLPEPAAARVVFNSDGTARIVFPQVELDGDAMNFFRDEFLPALGHGDVKRVRVCPICDNLFFALRLDQPACSLKCGRAHRAREFRRKAKRYEQNRKENRRRKAKREALRSKRK